MTLSALSRSARPAFTLPPRRRSPRRCPPLALPDKRRFPLPLVLFYLLTPFVLLTLWATDLRVQLFASPPAAWVTRSSLVNVPGAEPLSAVGADTLPLSAVGADALPSLERAAPPAKERAASSSTERAASPPTERAASPPTERAASPPTERAASPPTERANLPTMGLAAPPSTQRAHPPPAERAVSPPTDRDTTPRVSREDSGSGGVPAQGIPPKELPPAHPHAKLLTEIRAQTVLSPRWPGRSHLVANELRSYGPAYSSIVISHKLKAIYVPVFKVGTTSMMWNIAYLEQNEHILSQDLSQPGSRDYYLHEMGLRAWENHTIYTRSEEEISRYFDDPSYLKFGFVRDPFDRIISAYLDRVVRFDFGALEYQTQMYGLYGDDPEMRKLRNETKPTFREFLHGVRDVLKKPRIDPSSKATFEDNNSRRDLHWRPQTELLHPDLVHMDYVGRFESMERDREVVLKWMYQHTDRRMPKEHKKLHSTNPADKVALYEELRQDKALKDLVIAIYEEDFNRFQFSREVPSSQA